MSTGYDKEHAFINRTPTDDVKLYTAKITGEVDGIKMMNGRSNGIKLGAAMRLAETDEVWALRVMKAFEGFVERLDKIHGGKEDE